MSVQVWQNILVRLQAAMSLSLRAIRRELLPDLPHSPPHPHCPCSISYHTLRSSDTKESKYNIEMFYAQESLQFSLE